MGHSTYIDWLIFEDEQLWLAFVCFEHKHGIIWYYLIKTLADFNYDHLWYNTSSDMWNVKSKNTRHVENNVTIASNCWISWQFNCKHLLIVSNLDILLFNLKKPKFFSGCLWIIFYEFSFVWKSLFHYFVVVVYENLWQEQCNRPKIWRAVVVLEIHMEVVRFQFAWKF